jgi:hypothetical protein
VALSSLKQLNQARDCAESRAPKDSDLEMKMLRGGVAAHEKKMDNLHDGY